MPKARRRSYEPLPAPRRGGGLGREGLERGEEKMSTDQPTEARNAYRKTVAQAQKAYDEAMAPDPEGLP